MLPGSIAAGIREKKRPSGTRLAHSRMTPAIEPGSMVVLTGAGELALGLSRADFGTRVRSQCEIPQELSLLSPSVHRTCIITAANGSETSIASGAHCAPDDSSP